MSYREGYNEKTKRKNIREKNCRRDSASDWRKRYFCASAYSRCFREHGGMAEHYIQKNRAGTGIQCSSKPDYRIFRAVYQKRRTAGRQSGNPPGYDADKAG